MPNDAASFFAAPWIARRLHIHGTVQGVYFRQSTVEAARSLGLAGWVRNRRDGSVETLAVGTPEQVQALIDWAHQGPAAARVERVQVLEEALPEPLPGGFTQEATV
ncbi:acylphosphatase [Oryzisolibacter propanilivorax]|uniref:Acylphosphatase n=1 Tax=Oryzisolibacter propanilivorax TaxID=1527607 RepID=A0A1G9QK45_9BURK|nr:acylphosphatase [Oryzisolibacter propanilivorax]SDM10847.1 acylphosphatase [Oryzisolibacter propanilivorax]